MLNRPIQYKPEDVTHVGLYCLHRDLTYIASIKQHCETSSDITGYKFRRNDGQVFNYFEVLQDVSDQHISVDKRKGRNYPTLDDFIDGYKKLLDKGVINKGDINIAPLVQVQHQRAHFNTLVVYLDEDNIIHAYIIEPRSTDYMFNKMKDYGIQELANSIKTRFDKDQPINANAIKIGKQSITDDKTCGAHQINFTEVMTMLPASVFKTAADLQAFLAHTHLTRRKNDNDLIETITTAFGVFKDYKDKLQQKFDPEPSASSAATKVEDDSDDENAFTLIDEKNENALIYLHHPEFQQKLSTDFEAKRKQTPTDLIATSIQEIENGYIGKHKKSLQLFKSHTRHDTAKFINETLESIKNENIGDDKKLLKAALFLQAAFNSISDNKSELRLSLGHALAHLLDCKFEYTAQLSQSTAITVRNNLQTLFSEQIGFKLAFLTEDEALVLTKRFENIKLKLVEINSIDAGSRNDELRNSHIDSIKQEMAKIATAAAPALDNRL